VRRFLRVRSNYLIPPLGYCVFAANFVFTSPIMAEIRKNVKNIVIKADFVSKGGCEQGKA